MKNLDYFKSLSDCANKLKNCCLVSNFGSSFLNYIWVLIKPSLPSWSHTVPQTPFTNLICLSTTQILSKNDKKNQKNLFSCNFG